MDVQRACITLASAATTNIITITSVISQNHTLALLEANSGPVVYRAALVKRVPIFFLNLTDTDTNSLCDDVNRIETNPSCLGHALVRQRFCCCLSTQTHAQSLIIVARHETRAIARFQNIVVSACKPFCASVSLFARAL